jgi:GntR family transcriptional regulator
MNSTNDRVITDKPASGGGFSFSLDSTGGVPIYRQIIRQIEYGILTDRLRPGDRLPTIRALAVELKANPNTIARAYGELEIRNIVTTQVGSGTYISEKRPEPEDGRKRKIQEILERFIGEMKALGVGKDELLERIAGGFDE